MTQYTATSIQLEHGIRREPTIRKADQSRRKILNRRCCLASRIKQYKADGTVVGLAGAGEREIERQSSVPSTHGVRDRHRGTAADATAGPEDPT
jgi:hypothetical protein